MNVEIRPARSEDLDAARSILEDAGLPTTDLTVKHLAYVAESGDRFVGVIGLELYGAIGLLRSLVVSANARAAGVGRRLVTALETSARGQGMEALWLLTIDADPYFERLGFAVMDRSTAPAAIRNTAEFAGLCPDNAILMSKGL